MDDRAVNVGDTLWFVPSERRYNTGGRAETVAKVGRKWATMAGGHNPLRMDMGTWLADGNGYSSPGTFYRSREAYEEYQTVKDAWSNLIRRLTPFHPPEGVDLEWIDAAHKRLGIPK